MRTTLLTTGLDYGAAGRKNQGALNRMMGESSSELGWSAKSSANMCFGPLKNLS